MLQLKKTVVAVALGLGFASLAQAAVYDLGTLNSGQILDKAGISVQTTNVQYNHFDDRFTFTIEPGLASAELGVTSIDLTFSFGNIEITSLWINVYTDEVVGDVGNVLHASGWLASVDSFGKMSYKFEGDIDFTKFANTTNFVLRITGETADSGYGAYDLTLKGGPIAVVPEPAEYAMLLAGLGVVGMIARRRRMSIN